MAITFRHDAAAVAIPSTKAANRKYGMDLIARQDRKYADQQADANRMLVANQQPVRNNWQWDANAPQGARQGGQQAGGIIQQGGQRGAFPLTTTVDAQRQQQQEAEQRRKDFDAARARLDTYAREALANGQITDPTTRNELNRLIAGKAIVMGSGFNEEQQQEFLKTYDAELAKLLSNVPAAPAPPTREEQLRGFLGEDRYEADSKLPWVPDGKGGFVIDKDRLEMEREEQANRRPTSVDEVIAADPTKLKPYIDQEITALTSGDEKPLTPEIIDQAEERARRRYEKHLGLGTPTLAEPQPPVLSAPPIPLIAGGTGRPYTEPAPDTREERSILEPNLTAQTPDPGSPPMPPGPPPVSPPITGAAGNPPIPPGPPPSQSAPPAGPAPLTQSEIAAEMTARGNKPIVGTDGRTYWETANQAPPAAPSSPAQPSSQNPWGEIAAGGEGQASSSETTQPVTPMQLPPEKMPTASNRDTASGQASADSGSKMPKAPKPDFGKLIANATDEVDREFFGKVLDVYQGKPAAIQNAIAVAVSSDSSGPDVATALEYLKSKGIDLEQITAPPEPENPGWANPGWSAVG